MIFAIVLAVLMSGASLALTLRKPRVEIREQHVHHFHHTTEVIEKHFHHFQLTVPTTPDEVKRVNETQPMVQFAPPIVTYGGRTRTRVHSEGDK